MIFFGHELNAHAAGKGNNGIVLIHGIPNFFEIFVIALPLQGYFIYFYVTSLVEEIHSKG
jgi:hypothetical protein